MVDQVITPQELIDAQKDAQTLEEVVNAAPNTQITSRLGRFLVSLSTITAEKFNTDVILDLTSGKSQKQLNDELNSSITAVASGHKAYKTLADAQAAQASLSANTVVEVTNDSTASNNGTYQWNGTTLTKSAYDPLTQAKADTTAKVNEAVLNTIFANLARISSNPSLISYDQTIVSRESDGFVLLRWLKSGSALNTRGVFVAFKLDVVGAEYPTSYNDSNVFTGGGLRVQAFDSSGLKYTRNLVNLPNTKIWYYRGSDSDTALNINDVSEIKVSFNTKTGVTATLTETLLYPDNNMANAEPLAREKAINSKLLDFIESYLSTATVDTNLLNVTQGTSSSTAQIVTLITSPISRFSGLCIIETDGSYPTANSSTTGFRARIETETSALVAGNAAFLKRIGNTKVWYVMNAPVVGADISAVKIRATKPDDGTYVTIKNAVITDQGLPNPIQVLIKDAVDIDEIKSELEPFIEQMVTDQIASLNIEQYPTTAFEAIAQAATRRIDIVGIGDSNQYFGGYGFDYALRNALAARFGLYATPPLQGSVHGVATGATATQEARSLASIPYNYVADGSTAAGSGANALMVGTGSVASKYLLNPSSKLRCHFAYSTFSSGSGSFRVGIRLEESPYAIYAQTAVINTNSGSETYQLATLDLDSGSRDFKTLGFRFAQVSQSIVGPFLSYFMRVEDLNKNNGICFSTIYGQGGRSLWDMNNTMYGNLDSTNPSITGYTTPQLTNYFSEIRRLQLSKGLSPIVVVYINSGLNDVNETSAPSWGWRESADASSATAYLDNLEALAKQVSDVWQRNSWDETELFFWINPSHPISSPDNAKLRAYRKAAFTFAGSRARVSVVDFANLTSYEDLQSRDLYDAAGPYHLKKAGYEYCADLVVDRIP